MEWNTLDGYIIKEHLGQVAMSLWDTLYRWLCHHETLYIGGYVIMKHPMQIGISLRNAPCRCLCHCGIPCIGGYVIMEHPQMQMAISLTKTQKVQRSKRQGPKGQMRPKGPKFKMATKVNKTTSAIAETCYFQNSHSMFIKPTVFLVRSVVEDGISITVY